MADIFISYSRKDAAFVEVLRNALLAAKRDVWLDKTDIPATAAWLAEIYAAIDAASAFVVVLSPDYLASETCQQELARAVEGQKKLIPIVCREVNAPDVPAPLRALNWIFWRMTDQSDQAFGTILRVLDTDLDYARGGARWLVRARDWEAKTRNASFTLRGKELLEAEQWVASSGGKVPPPAALALEYIASSRTTERQRQRVTVSSLTVGIIVTLVLAIISSVLFQVTRAQNSDLQQRDQRLAALAIAGQGSAALLNNQVDRALLLQALANRKDDSFETRTSLFQALEYSPHLEAVLQTSTALDTASAPSHETGLATAFSHDGQHLMVAYDDGHVNIWDLLTFTKRTVITQTDALDGADFSPDGKLIVTKGQQHGITLWDAATGAQIAQLASQVAESNSSHRNILFSPDGTLLASTDCTDTACAGGQITLWNVTSHEQLGTYALAYPATAAELAFSPDGSMLAATECQDPTCVTGQSRLDLWRISKPALLATYLLSQVTGQGSAQTLAFSPDGKLVVVGGCYHHACIDGQLLWCKLAAVPLTCLPTLEDSGPVLTLAFSGDGQTVIAGAGTGAVHLWDVNTQTPEETPLPGHTNTLTDVAATADGLHFVTAGIDNRILYWRMGAFSNLSKPLGGDVDGSSQVAFSPDGKLEAVGATGKITLWDVSSGQRVGVLQATAGVEVNSLAFSADSKTLASGNLNGAVTLWNVATLHQIGAPIAAHQPCTLYLASVTFLAFSPDGRLLVSGGFDGQVVVTDVATQQTVHVFARQDNCRTYNASFSPDGRFLYVAGGDNNTIAVWDVPGQRDLAPLTGPQHIVQAVANSPDGRYLAALAEDGVITIWDAQTRKLVGPVMRDQGGDVFFYPNLAFSPDSHMLVSAHDRSITLWDLAARQPYIRPLLRSNYVINAVFTPDGTQLATAINQGPIEVRYVTLAGWRSSACQIANRNLTRAEWQQYVQPYVLPGEQYAAVCPNLPVPTN